jgi:hypothetical protein
MFRTFVLSFVQIYLCGLFSVRCILMHLDYEADTKIPLCKNQESWAFTSKNPYCVAIAVFPVSANCD